MEDQLIKDMKLGVRVTATLTVEKISTVIPHKTQQNDRQKMLLSDKNADTISMTFWQDNGDRQYMGIFQVGDIVKLSNCQPRLNTKYEPNVLELITGDLGIVKLVDRPKLPETEVPAPEPKKEQEVEPKIVAF